MDFTKLDRAALRAKASGGKLKQYGVNGMSSSAAIVAALEQEAAAKATPASSPKALLRHALGHATAAVAADVEAHDYARAGPVLQRGRRHPEVGQSRARRGQGEARHPQENAGIPNAAGDA